MEKNGDRRVTGVERAAVPFSTGWEIRIFSFRIILGLRRLATVEWDWFTVSVRAFHFEFFYSLSRVYIFGGWVEYDDNFFWSVEQPVAIIDKIMQR
jgi:hypothetical protein